MWFVKTPFSSNSDLDEKFKRICEEAADIRQDSARRADTIVHVVRHKIEGGEPEGGRLPLAMTCGPMRGRPIASRRAPRTQGLIGA